MKRIRRLLLLTLPLLLLLASCGNRGKLNEGDCAGTITLQGLPKEFSLLEENLQKEFEVRVTLQNMTTDKDYVAVLNQKNEFKQSVSLHPGTYRVSAYASITSLTHLHVKTTADTVTFERDKEASVIIVPENVDEFTSHWMESHPQAEILSADKFSRLVQVNRKVMPIKDVVTELDLSDMDKMLAGYQKTTLTDNERGVSIVLQNKMSSDQPLSKCEVVSLSVTSNTVIFPDGVSLGSSPAKVCHKQTGLYGQPTRFEGFFLYGWDLDKTKAIYLDPISGDRITITFLANGSSISEITYEMEVFE
ncbi:MAG: hypothetical protein IKO03_07440 [Lachnospiraceae bacterium]|nr:hypothetical protein [Lachnospiraceae bacterium]MBR3508580.1 hypothetical protein [Lachnospiraceae bacterium]MBR4608808.1 hypothetical protein [Lachnospiraceae bacterium]